VINDTIIFGHYIAFDFINCLIFYLLDAFGKIIYGILLGFFKLIRMGDIPEMIYEFFDKIGGRYSIGGGIKDVIVYDNNGETNDRYTIFTPDGSVYGMSDIPNMPNGFNQYLGDNTEIEQGSHLGKKLNSVPKSIQKAIMNRMSESKIGYPQPIFNLYLQII
jgi:hypothetical protein